MADAEQEPVITPVTEGPPVGEGKPGFLSTPAGKIVVIGGAVAALLIVVGVIAAIFLFNFLGKATEQALTTAAPVAKPTSSVAASGSKEPTRTAAATETPKATARAGPDTVFVFRDPFVPLVKAQESTATTSGTSGSSTASGTASAEDDTLTLQDVVSVNGVRKAKLNWDGANYELAAGEVIEGTPWKVLSIGDDSVVMLYGDVQVSLSVGEGVAKGVTK